MILSKLSDLSKKDFQTRQVIENLKNKNAKVSVGGVAGGLEALLFSVIQQELKEFVLIITPSLLAAERTYSDLLNFIPEDQLELLHPLDAYPHEPTTPSEDLQGQRIAALNNVLNGKAKILIAPIKSFIFYLGDKDLIFKHAVMFEIGQKVNLDRLSEQLVKIGYDRVSLVGEKGEFAVRGGIVDIFPPAKDQPYRIELDGEEIASIREVDVLSQRSRHKLEKAEVLPAKELIGRKRSSIADYLPKDALIFISEKLEATHVIDDLAHEVAVAAKFDHKDYLQFMNFTSEDDLEIAFRDFRVLYSSTLISPKDLEIFSYSQTHNYIKRMDDFIADLKKRVGSTVIVSKHALSIKELLHEAGLATADRFHRGVISVFEGKLSKGFNLEDLKVLVLSDFEIFGEGFLRSRHEKPATQGADQIHTFDLSPGSFIVHENYGIGKYLGLEVLEDVGPRQEYLSIEYAAGDKLNVPLNSMGLISKYSTGGDFQPRLDKLGAKRWLNTKRKAKKKIKDITKKLLSIYAEREAREGYAFAPDNIWQMELESSFPYDETKDQLRAIDQVKTDMELNRPMDRLICGDVGYGKTEVAIRAAVKAVASGKQVAVLVPTTVLAQQHYLTFVDRLKSFPIKVEMLSRFRSKAEQKEIVENLKLGNIDIVVGTHRLVGKDIEFKDLGLLIIDEEQRFGVTHKERVKEMRKTIDVMTLSATPIPRTLYMSLSGIRDFSMINTPPVDRSPVRTYVLEWNEAVVREAILREVERGGQIYFVHNLVQSIEQVKSNLKRLVPEVKVVVAHGQMREDQLEKNVIDFFQKKYDLLLCTAIIESGIDMPNVNTIIIDNADRLGLAQLYQLRGRVGRSATRAYGYLFYRRRDFLTLEAIKRLKAIQEFTKLGSGYKLALRDLEIRGSGNVMGSQQHGHLVAVGFDLYCELVQEAVAELKGIKETAPREVIIDIKADAYIPPQYVSEERERIALYRRMNLLAIKEEVMDMKREFKDRFGQLPKEVEALFRLLYLKVRARLAGVKSIRGDVYRIVVDFAGIPDKNVVRKLIDPYLDRMKLTGKRLFYDIEGQSFNDWISNLQNIFSENLV
ncbi:MAG: transcription-repair coupling factor [Candidatus Margulisbacteria bacterium]|nr:transcription-repair coupling factor [Candidatus Margulisiibacteriota bacterium]MBU1022485.1 transcription-repair coupling factor [Candidatus Margulisiibacteriota bacterium]MBU1728469.1 transcription-repair coupling factor [Candidatus Margulisiibacteriota bacterium]MBU1954616.1 transcription-repair coupling factor [Candidatus Margulisiibacteriota bacterium]